MEVERIEEGAVAEEAEVDGESGVGIKNSV